MNERQVEIAKVISRLAALFAGGWISDFVQILASPFEYERTAALLILRDLATGNLPPLPTHTARRLADEAEAVLETIVDPDLHTLCLQAMKALQEAAKAQPPGDVLPVWAEQFRPSDN